MTLAEQRHRARRVSSGQRRQPALRHQQIVHQASPYLLPLPMLCGGPCGKLSVRPRG
jgi:hypothetical protein